MRMATGSTHWRIQTVRETSGYRQNLPIKTPTVRHTMTHIVNTVQRSRYRALLFDIALPPNFLQYLYHFVCFEDFTKRYYLHVHNKRGVVIRHRAAICEKSVTWSMAVIHAQLSQSSLWRPPSRCTWRSRFRGFSRLHQQLSRFQPSHAFSVTVSTTQQR